MVNKQTLKVTFDESSIEITSQEMNYSCIFDMYMVEGTPRDGIGLQIDEYSKKDKIKKLASDITAAIKEYLHEKV